MMDDIDKDFIKAIQTRDIPGLHEFTIGDFRTKILSLRDEFSSEDIKWICFQKEFDISVVFDRLLNDNRILKIYLENGGNPDIRCSLNGESLIDHIYRYSGDCDNVKLLESYGVKKTPGLKVDEESVQAQKNLNDPDWCANFLNRIKDSIANGTSKWEDTKSYQSFCKEWEDRIARLTAERKG